MLSDSVKCTFSVIMLHMNQWLLRGRGSGSGEDGIKDRHLKQRSGCSRYVYMHSLNQLRSESDFPSLNATEKVG